ncbi:protein fantom [Channa argus]|uniref:protein fantom n=1 Tax=Channa argus TaxID=215402 RepID=UPI003520A9F6
MEQLAAGGNHPVSRVRDIEMEEMMEELQEKVRGLQTENEGLKQRLLIAKQQLMNSQCRRPAPYNHVQSRVNSGLKKLRDDTPSPLRPKSTRSLEGGARPPTGQLPRYGQSLLEEARAEIRNLENVIESQRSQMEEMEAASELLREEVRRKEAEYEENLLQVRQQQTSKLRSHVNSNVMMMKLQKQLADRSSVVTELEGRFQHLQESQQTLKASHDAALLRVEELSAQLKNEWMKSLDLEKQLQSSTISKIKMEQLQERISELEQERDLLKENNEKLVNSALDISQQQKWKIQEQQLRLQIAQLEAALKADLIDKNEILDKIKAERGSFLNPENDYNASELTEALLQIKSRKSQRNGDLGFLKEVDEEGNSNKESSIRELRAAHAETIQELEKTRNILSMESKISKDYKAELEAVLRKMESDKVEYDQKLKQQAQLLDTRAAKIKKLEAKLRDIAYGNTNVFKPDITDEDDAGEFDKTLNLEHGENLLELQIISAMLSSSALETLGDHEPSTFFTYSFYLFEMHSTPVVMGHKPKYGFTSKYVVSMDDRFLDYIHRCSLTVELHQALGLDWKTLATGRIRLQQLLEKDGKINGTIPLVGLSDEVQSFGSVDYWLRLRIPMTETIRLYKEKLKAVGYTSIAQSEEAQPHNRSWNELFITVQRCRDLQSSTSQQPSPYVVYKFFDFPDYPTVTVQDCCDPHFSDLKSYSVLMDVDLDQYLKSEEVQFYVFDYKEELIDTYLGKARVPLLSLAQGKGITGVYELIDPSGRLAGHIEVTLEWKSTYLPPSGLIVTVEKPKFIRKEMLTEETVEQEPECHSEKANKKDKLLTDKDLEEILEEGEEARDPFYCSPPFSSKVVSEVTPAHQGAVEQEDDEEESHISEGQLVPAGSQSYSDDSDVSEEITKDEAPAAREDQSESTQSDSDDCIVHGQATGRKPSDRLRVEVVSLILRPESRVARDSSVVRLFVEYSFLDLPTEETPLSLPKPPQGKGINFNYSKVIPVDAENNGARRQLLREVLQGQNPQMERIRFTVVSEPPEEEEQERECEDVGVTFLRISDILEKQRDLMETSLSVVDVEDNSDVVGSLTVSVEGLEALRAIMEDQDLSKRTPVSSLLPST